MYDVIFLSFDEAFADAHYKKLKTICPIVHRVHGISGIVSAHKKAAKSSSTKFFWVVDADAIVFDDFEFDFVWQDDDEFYHEDSVRIYTAVNSINLLTYGYGGIKLLPKDAVLNCSDDVIDFTTSISNNIIVDPVVASTTFINYNAFSAWKSAFRECVKLEIQEKTEETELRKMRWLDSKINNIEHSDVCSVGAMDGIEYAKKHKNNRLALQKINDFEWLRNEFGAKGI